MCKILNAKQVGKTSTANRVYVGRPSKWGNPFALGKDSSRSEVIAKYRRWVVTQTDLLNSLDELQGKDLICWCAPRACHAEVLRELANGSGAT